MPRWADDLMIRLALGAVQRKAATQAPVSGGGSGAFSFTGPQTADYPSARSFQHMMRFGFSGNPYLFRAVMYTANACAGIPWLLYDKRGKEKTEVQGHPLLTLINAKANQREGAARMWIRLNALMLLAGDAYLLAITSGKQVTELYAIRPDRMQAKTSQSGEIQQWVYTVGSVKQYYDPAIVRHLTEFSPEDDNAGLAPAKVAARAIDQHNAANDWNTALLQNMARPGGLLAPALTTGEDAVMTVPQWEALKADVEAKMMGPRNAGRPLIPMAPMKWTPMGESPSEMDWLNGKTQAAREIAIALAVPPELLGDAANKTYSNLSEARRSFYTETVLPRMDVLKSELNSWLLPLYGLDLERYELDYDTDDIEALQEDRQAIYDRAYKGWTAGLLTLDQALKMIGESEVGGDLGGLRIIPSTYVPLEQALEPPEPAPVVHLTPADGNAPQLPAGTSSNNAGNSGGGQPASSPASRTAGTPPKMLRLRARNKAISLATEEQKAAHWRKTETSREAWYGTVGEQVAGQFKAEHKAVVAAVKGASSAKRAVKAAQRAIDDGAWSDLIAAIYLGVGEPFARQAVDDVTAEAEAEAKALSVPQRQRKATSGDADADDDVADGWTRYVTRWLKTQGAARVRGITDTTRQKIADHLADGVEAGESLDQLAARIDSLYLDSMIPNRSMVIARTETLTASNQASIFGARSTGLPLQKEWIATRDGRTREDHADADGQLVGLDEPFVVGGVEMDVPGASGDPEQDVNCRCTIGWHVIEEGA